MQRRLARKRAQAQSASQSTGHSAGQSATQSGSAQTRRQPTDGANAGGLLRSQANSASSNPKRLRRKLMPGQRPPESRQARPAAERQAPSGRLPAAPASNQMIRPTGNSNSNSHSSSNGQPANERVNLRLKPTRSNPGSPANSLAQREQRSGSPNRLSRTASAPGQATRLHQAARPGSREQGRSPRPASPLVHLCRLLILGVGVGAIVGTVISIWNPSLRNPATANRVGTPNPTQQLSPNRPGAVPGTLATISSVRMGREMTELVAKVTPLTRDLTDLVPGIFLSDLDNGDYLSFNGSTAFSAASMIKMPILIAFLQDVDAGKIKLDEMLSMQQADIAEGSGDMQYSTAGSEFTALDTATNMIIHSDNTATNMIVRRLGGNEALNQRFRQWGLQQTLLRKPLPDLEGLNTTSPKELVSLMALLNDGKLVSMKSRDRAFDIMRRTVTATLLPSVLAPDTSIAHKTGDIGSLVGDVGLIDMPSGRRYAIAVVVKRPHNDGRAQDLIRQVAAVVYEHFGGKPTVAPSPVAVPPAQVAPNTNPAQPGMTPMAPGMVPGAVAPGAVGVPGMTPVPGAVPAAPVTPVQQAPQNFAPVPTAIPEAETPAPDPAATSPDTSDPGTSDPASATNAEPPADEETGNTI